MNPKKIVDHIINVGIKLTGTSHQLSKEEASDLEDLEAAERSAGEARAICMALSGEHLDQFLSFHPDATYENWLFDLHPEILASSRGDLTDSLDHRFYLKDSDHLILWNSHRAVSANQKVHGPPIHTSHQPLSASAVVIEHADPNLPIALGFPTGAVVAKSDPIKSRNIEHDSPLQIGTIKIECHCCTYVNAAHFERCEVCDELLVRHDDAAALVSSIANTSTLNSVTESDGSGSFIECEKRQMENKNVQHTAPITITSSLSERDRTIATSLECSACTFLNQLHCKRCEVCESPLGLESITPLAEHRYGDICDDANIDTKRTDMLVESVHTTFPTSRGEPFEHPEQTLLDFDIIPNHVSTSSAFLGDVFDLTPLSTVSPIVSAAALPPFSTSKNPIPASLSVESATDMHPAKIDPALGQQNCLADDLDSQEGVAPPLLSTTERELQLPSTNSFQTFGQSLHRILVDAKLTAFENELKRLGFCELEDLIEAPDSELLEAGLKSAEIRRLHRYLQARDRVEKS